MTPTLLHVSLRLGGILFFSWLLPIFAFATGVSIPPAAREFAMGAAVACRIQGQMVYCNGAAALFPGARVFRNPRMVSAGDTHACALDDDGVACWGEVQVGAHSIQPPPLKNPRQLVSGANHACALDDGGVKCWGDNSNGQTQVPNLIAPSEIAAGGAHSCAIAQGKVRCWGLGIHEKALQPPRDLQHPRMLAAGKQHVCVVTDSGVKCWGLNYESGAIPKLNNISLLVSGGREITTCAVDDSGIHCWGEGSLLANLKPPSVSATHVRALGVSDYQACVLEDDDVRCWSDLDYDIGLHFWPTLKNPRFVAVSGKSTCFYDDYGLRCLGLAHVPSLQNLNLLRGSSGGGRDRFCAIDSHGLICFGSGSGRDRERRYPQFAQPLDVAFSETSGGVGLCVIDGKAVKCRGAYRKVPAMGQPMQIVAGAKHVCALSTAGVKCWGDSKFGQLAVPALKNPSVLSAAGFHTCAIDDEGLKCWGGDMERLALSEFSHPRLMTSTDFDICAADDHGTKCWGAPWEYQNRIPVTQSAYAMNGDWSRGCLLESGGARCWGDRFFFQLPSEGLR